VDTRLSRGPRCDILFVLGEEMDGGGRGEKSESEGVPCDYSLFAGQLVLIE